MKIRSILWRILQVSEQLGMTKPKHPCHSRFAASALISDVHLDNSIIEHLWLKVTYPHFFRGVEYG